MAAKQKNEDLATQLTEWVGTPVSILVHTFLFAFAFIFVWLGVALDTVLLVLTTMVSLEAIYLALFIQMTVNRNTRSLEEVEEDIEEIQEDVKEIETDVGEISEDVEELAEDVDKIHEIEQKETVADTGTRAAVEKIEKDLQRLMEDIKVLKGT
ncbi:MAG: DUF1003 domain-containing protein [Candidatus Sungbacteria bacterium]|nr:DUF1003 domain-containing protein [Candidatus Sungbacteria bacterium]